MLFSVKDLNPILFQLGLVDRGVVTISSKAVYGVDKYGLKMASLRILNHALEISTIIGLA